MTPALTTHQNPRNAGLRLTLALVALLLLAVPVALVAETALQSRPNDAGPALITMEAANALYATGQYEVAAQAYQQLMEQGHGGRALLYNLSVAQLEAGFASDAVESLRTARRAYPRDADIRTALADAERMQRMALAPDAQADAAAPAAKAGILANIRLHWISATETAIAALLLWTLLAALLLIAYATPRGSGRRRLAGLSAIIAGGALVFALLLLTA